uniref:(northern house mosquito) hypothetical protein n=1 Tax=Culex pipiens TaxID=7175 RepID=A0A8D8CTT6_CULPI
MITSRRDIMSRRFIRGIRGGNRFRSIPRQSGTARRMEGIIEVIGSGHLPRAFPSTTSTGVRPRGLRLLRCVDLLPAGHLPAGGPMTISGANRCIKEGGRNGSHVPEVLADTGTSVDRFRHRCHRRNAAGTDEAEIGSRRSATSASHRPVRLGEEDGSSSMTSVAEGLTEDVTGRRDINIAAAIVTKSFPVVIAPTGITAPRGAAIGKSTTIRKSAARLPAVGTLLQWAADEEVPRCRHPPGIVASAVPRTAITSPRRAITATASMTSAVPAIGVATGTTEDHLRPGWIAVAEAASTADVAARSGVVAAAWNAAVVGTFPMTRVADSRWTPTGSRRDQTGRVASVESEVHGHRVDGPRRGQSLASGTGIEVEGGGLVRRRRR